MSGANVPDAKCLPLGALVATGSRSTVFQGMDTLFLVNSTLAATQYAKANKLIDRITRGLNERAGHAIEKSWENAQGKKISALPLSILQGRKPTILTTKADLAKSTLACRKVLGYLLNPVKTGDYSEISLLLNHLGLESTYVGQTLASSSAKYLSSYENSKEILLPIPDLTPWAGFDNKPLGVSKGGKYLHFADDDEKPFICLTPTDVGETSLYAESELKILIRNLTQEFHLCSTFMSRLCNTFNIESIQQHLPESESVSDNTIHLSFSAWSTIQKFIYNHRIQYLESAVEVSQQMLEKLKKLLELLRNFNSNNAFLGKSFKLQISSDFFDKAPGPTYTANTTAIVSYITRLANHAVVSLPLVQSAVEYNIIPFINENKIFKYKYYVQSPLFDYVSDTRMVPSCANTFGETCNHVVDTECAKAFKRSKVDAACMKSASNFNAVNVLSCQGAGEAALVVSTSSVIEATLDCFNDNDFLLTLPPSTTTWLKPCLLRSNNIVLSPLLGSIPYNIKDAYSHIKPVISMENSLWSTVYVAVGLVFLFLLTTALAIVSTVCFIKRRQARHGQLAIQAQAPEAGMPMQVFNYNLASAPQAMHPPSSGFVEPLNIE